MAAVSVKKGLFILFLNLLYLFAFSKPKTVILTKFLDKYSSLRKNSRYILCLRTFFTIKRNTNSIEQCYFV